MLYKTPVSQRLVRESEMTDKTSRDGIGSIIAGWDIRTIAQNPNVPQNLANDLSGGV